MSPDKFAVLVFSKTAGYRHESIPAAIEGIKQIGIASDAFTVDSSEDPSFIDVKKLSRYAVVIFLQTSGDFLGEEQLAALQTYVRSGGGFLGIHCAAAGMTKDPWYGELIGAVFTDHPEPQDGLVTVENKSHVIVAGLPEKLEWFDEWYYFDANPRMKVTVLLSIDERTYKGGKLGEDHPLAWCREFDGGRSFYTSLGHFDEAYSDEKFMGHILNGVLWAARKV
ncbi:glycosyl hydrolase [Annulohypoxylon maeteangense]|uniref:glycosyl hydrolase n=1 Tax=Annulohypoxylon maeteangense TaxID=1927788 RepID=UPI00200790B7|nr:glycosyl hydrolase [Annulohypoxylon maeteangense]KAI0884038.1 glycosyl hydrolase [Annulohypoxylon maeteangense]